MNTLYISIAGPEYRGAPYPRFNAKKINESKFEDGCRAKFADAVLHIDNDDVSNSYGEVTWISQDTPSPTQKWMNEVRRAFTKNGLPTTSPINAKFKCRDNRIYTELSI